MLSREDNEILTNTNPGTPMGELFRRFWLPVMMASELATPDCVPVRQTIMGEDLIAFRDSKGCPGLVDAYCPHRGASMFFGRNEEAGLRCIYHGWKFDVTGRCVDIPNCSEGDTFKDKIRIRSYPVVEAGSLLWAYMGPPEKQPPFPHFQFANLPAENIYVSKFLVECNWAQSLDGAWDFSHGHFLHSALAPNGSSALEDRIQLADKFDETYAGRGPFRPDRPLPDFRKGPRPEETETPNGNYMTWVHEMPGGVYRAETVPWHLPMFDGFGIAGNNIYASNIRIPIDNESIYWFRYRWSPQPIPEDLLGEWEKGGYVFPELIPGTFVTAANRHNDYMINRVHQRQFSYSGIHGFPMQDIAVSENQWGRIADRTKEHLCSSDYQNIYWRNRIIRTAKALANGIEPKEPWAAESYRNHNAIVVSPSPDEALAEAHRRSGEWVVPVDPPYNLAPTPATNGIKAAISR